MERREKGGKREGILMVEKLKHVEGKRGSSTPPPIWRLEFPSLSKQQNSKVQEEFLNFPTSSSISARKLCAKLWEIQPHIHHHRDTVLEVPKQPKSARGLKKHVHLASFVQHHRSVERNCAPQPVSAASCSSSTEVVPHKRVNPTSSLYFKGRIGESNCNLKTSRELLKVLNRIWCLEEQNRSNISVVKTLKKELNLSQKHIKELLREEQMNKQEMENLMKQITEEKLIGKNKECDKIKAAVQSSKEEIGDERRLRKHSENLRRKLAKELSEVKSSFCDSLRDLERERKARILLENLCDDFAKGIRDYEHEVRFLMHHSEKSQVKGDNSHSLDRLILHISEAWLDERKQMKLVQTSSDLPMIESIVDKLGVDIETFLHAKRSVDLRGYGKSTAKELKEIYPCLHSLDSFPLKHAASAPHNMAKEDSVGTDIFEPKRTCDKGLEKFSFILNSNATAEIHKEKKRSHNSARKQVKSKEMTDLQGKNTSCDENDSPSEIGGDMTALLNATGVSTVFAGNSSLSSEGNKVYPESICREDSWVHSAVTGNGSPVKQWKQTMIVPDFDMHRSGSKV